MKSILTKITIVIVILIPTIIVSLNNGYFNNSGFWLNVWSGNIGTIVQLIFITILLEAFVKKYSEEIEVKSLRKTIDFYRSRQNDISSQEILLAILKLNEYKITKIDLTKCRLQREEAHMIDLKLSDLSSAAFVSCRLTKAVFSKAVLVNTIFENCVLTDSIFKDSQLTGSIFRNCNLSSTDFTNANLSGIEFSETILRDARFDNAIIDNADFSSAFAINAEQLINIQSAKNVKLSERLLIEIKVFMPEFGE